MKRAPASCAVMAAALIHAAAYSAVASTLPLTNAAPDVTPLQTNMVADGVPSLTSGWRLAWSRAIPLARAAADPLVVAAGRNQRLWIADQSAHEVCAYSTRGRRHARLRVANRGTIVALDFDRAERLLVAQQRREERVPLGEVRVFDTRGSAAASYQMLRSRTYPKYWTGRSVASEIILSRERDEYTMFTPPGQLLLRAAAITPRGSVYVIVPVLSTMERFAADGDGMTTYLMSELRPLSPCWLIATRASRLLMGDARNERILLLDTVGRLQRAWPQAQVGDVIPCARPGGGWVLLDPHQRRAIWHARDGGLEASYTIPPAYTAVTLPDERTLWLFDTTAWTWDEYRSLR